jgi:hypothetical protein
VDITDEAAFAGCYLRDSARGHPHQLSRNRRAWRAPRRNPD